MNRHATNDELRRAHAIEQLQRVDQSREYRLSLATQERRGSIGEGWIRIHQHDGRVLFSPANLTTELINSLHELCRREPTHTTQNPEHRFCHLCLVCLLVASSSWGD